MLVIFIPLHDSQYAVNLKIFISKLLPYIFLRLGILAPFLLKIFRNCLTLRDKPAGLVYKITYSRYHKRKSPQN